MAHFRRSILIILFACIVFAPNLTLAAGFFGPIVPAQCHCDNQAVQGGGSPVTSAPDYGCVLAVIQNLIKVAVSLGVILMVIWIAYAGFSLMVSGGSPEARSQGKTRIMNALVGIVVILAAWLIVNFIMNVLYNGTFGAWNSILAGDSSSQCITPKQPTAITAGSVLTNLTSVPPGTSNPTGSNLGVARGLCADSNTRCSVAVLEQAGLSQAQAMAMSCIAVTESSGGYNQGNSGTGAQGLFQITLTNWNNPAYHSGSCSSATSRLNYACNLQTAVLMFRNVGYQPWAGVCNQSRCGNVTYGQYWNPNAAACVNKYDPQS